MPSHCQHCDVRTGEKHRAWCLCILIDMAIERAAR